MIACALAVHREHIVADVDSHVVDMRIRATEQVAAVSVWPLDRPIVRIVDL